MPFRSISLLLLFAIPAHVAAAEYRPYVDVQSVTYSEPVAIQAMLGKWQPPFRGGNKAFTYTKAEIGIRRGNWQLGILKRVDYQLKFASETAQLIYLTENRLPLEAGREYELRLKVQHNYSRGLRLAYQHKLSPRFRVGLAASYLQGKALTDGALQGSAQVTAEKDYDFQFDTDYFYSRDALFERDVTSPSGQGYSVDFNIDWQASKQFSAQLSVIDIVGKMFWDNAPFTIAAATSDTKTFDADGYVLYQPAISGLESNKNFTQTLPRKIFIASQYQWSSNVAVLAEVQDFKIIRFASIGGEWCDKNKNCFQTLFNTTVSALSLRYRGHGFRIELASDKLDIKQARYLSLQLSFNQAF